MSDTETKGTRLRGARGEKTLDQAAAAYEQDHGNERGISRTTISEWEHDRRWPNLVILKRYCDTLKVDINDIDPKAAADLKVVAGFGTSRPVPYESPNPDGWAARDSNPEPAESLLAA